MNLELIQVVEIQSQLRDKKNEDDFRPDRLQHGGPFNALAEGEERGQGHCHKYQDTFADYEDYLAR
jgi:hypothetical protein